jgi:hypothetical protein
VAPSSVHGSLLPKAEQYLEIFPQERCVGTERIRIVTLETAAAEFLAPSARVGVKIDVQGYELEVARGARDLLNRAVFVECELLLAELYKGQARLDQLAATFYGAGLRLASFDRAGIDERTGAAMWGDGIFVRGP